MARAIDAVVAQSVEDDCVAFDRESVRADRMREGEDYEGVRVTLIAKIAGARLPIQIDIGFGDVVTPEPRITIYPSLLEFPPPQLKAYPPETVIAEKLEALVSLGMRNSRMKDFFDIWAIGTTFDFEGKVLSTAISRTFARPRTVIPNEPPLGLTSTFSADSGKQAQWRAFLKRTALTLSPQSFEEIVAFNAGFLLPPLSSAGGNERLKNTGRQEAPGHEQRMAASAPARCRRTRQPPSCDYRSGVARRISAPQSAALCRFL